MSTNLAQVIITVRIEKNKAVSYSYTDPKTKKPVEWSSKCRLEMDQPTFCLFQLEIQTVKDGWSIKQIFPNGTPVVPYEIGPFDLSVNTYFDDAPKTDYKFFIMYHNRNNNQSLFVDPQELNTPPPGDGSPK